ncbi:MAG: acyltransferase family protein [Clostridiales bacterium]|nr:acyltransferase family protein [Clostridiales bacterium]
MATATDRSLINFIRGSAVFLMLWGHCIQCCCGGQFDFFENTVFKIIYAFHMPLFMLVSGYLFFFSAQKRDLTELIEYKTKSLLYPILMCSVFHLVFTKSFSVLRGKFSGILGGTSLTDYWFLWSVIACSISLGLSVKITRKVYLQGLFILCGVICVALLPCWESNVYMYPYFIIGYLYARNKEKLGRIINYIGPVSLAAYIAMLIFFRKEHYIYVSGIFGGESFSESLIIDLFRWGIGLVGSCAAVWICKLLHPVLKIKLKTLIEKTEKLGEHSLAVYTLSVSFLSFLLPVIANKVLFYIPVDLNKYIWLYNLVITTVLAVGYSVFLLLLIRLLKKIGLYRLLFGR